jgi:hypothetical protein
MAQDVTIHVLACYCAGAGLFHQLHEDDNFIVVVLPTGGAAAFLGIIQHDVERSVVSLRVGRLAQVPEARRAAVAMALAHLNYTRVLGRYALDLHDGELEWRLTFSYEDVGVSEAQLLRAILATGASLEQDVPLLQRLVDGEEDPEAVLGCGASGTAAVVDEDSAVIRSLLESLRREEDDGKEDRSA